MRLQLPPFRYFLSGTLSYVALGILGFAFAPLPGHVSLLFPAAGLALALILWGGPRMLTAVWMGSALSFTVLSVHLQIPAATGALLAVAVASGATLQAFLGSYFVRRCMACCRLESERNIALFMLLGGPLACLISATVGLSALSLAGILSMQDFGYFWIHWWLGDSLGVLIATPLCLLILYPGEPIWRARRVALFASTLLICALLMTALQHAARWEQDRYRAVIKQHGEDLTQRLQQRFNAIDGSLSALRRLIEVVPDMSFDQFQYFTRITLQDSKEISALSFNPWVAQTARRDFEKAQAAKLALKSFQIVERDAQGALVRAGERSTYLPVGYIAPLDANWLALGFDIDSEKIRREAIARARQSGKPAATQPLQLVQDRQRRTGILLLHPAYRQLFFMADRAESKELIGFAVAVLKVEEMVQLATWNVLPAGMVFHLADHSNHSEHVNNANATAAATPLFQSDAGVASPDADYVWRSRLTLADRQWGLSVFPTADYLRQHRSWMALAVGFAGLLFAAVLQLLILGITGRTAVVQRKVDEQTAELRAKSDALLQLVDEHEDLIRRMPVGVYKLRMARDGGFDFIYVSPLWCEQLGVTADAVAADPQVAFRHVHQEDLALFLRSQEEARLALKPYEWEGRFLRDDVVRWLHLRSVPTLLENGDIIWDGVQADITERKRTDEERRLLSTAVAQSNASMVITDRDGNIVFVNDAFVATTGYTRDEAIGQSPRLLQSGVTALATYQTLWQTIMAGQTWRGELQNKKKSGELYWEFATISPVLDDKGGVTHFIAIKDNITERKRQEVEIRQAKEEAEAANLAKSQFLATMSHEIRTPMNGILGMAQLLLIDELSESERKDYIRTILNSGTTLQALLDDILDLSKVEAGKLELKPGIFDPHRVLDETVALFSGPARQKGLSIEAAWHGPESRYYLADAIRIRQMLSNLLSNAIKFTATGQVRVDAAEITADDHQALLAFSVTDSGIGIATDKIEQLFKPFSQIDASRTRAYGGTGLGLSIVKRVAELMGGSIGVDSLLGKGSRFWFRIKVDIVPLEEESRLGERLRQRDILPTHPTHRSAPLCCRALVVDNNAINRKVVEALLTQLGLTVSVAENGQQAVEAITHGKVPDVVLIDTHMPVLDGYAATEQIRQWERQNSRPRLPIIALTAEAFAEDRARCMTVGMDDFLAMPIAASTLQAVLGKWLRQEAKRLPEPSLPAILPPLAASAAKTLNAEEFFTRVDELMPLLAQSKFAAITRFKELKVLANGTAIAEDIGQIEAELAEFRFDRAREDLRRIAITVGWKDHE